MEFINCQFEIYKPLKRFPGYEVSNYGRIKSKKGLTERILKQHLNTRGYLSICFYYPGGIIVRNRVHRLVYEAFHGLPPDGDEYQIDHIDGDTLNNDPSNLRSVTHALNCGNHKKYKNNTSGLRGVREHVSAQ